MPAPISNDLRKRIVEARKRGQTIPQIAKEKDVSVSMVERLLKRYRETGSYEPSATKKGRKPGLSEEQLEQIRERILQKPDILLRELMEELELEVSPSVMSRTVREKLGFKRKKKLLLPLNGSEGTYDENGKRG